MNIPDNNVSYILPLDSIDINYISEAKSKHNSSVLLWNGNKFGKSSHYEFQIWTSKKNEVADGDYDSNYKIYKCKVCDIDVPKMFKKQHNSSSKHKFCLKIIEKVLERTKDSMLQNCDDEDDDSPKCPQGFYFCEPCAHIIKVKNKKEHEMTKSHFKSVMHDKFLKDLLNIYCDKDYIDEVRFDYMNFEGNEDDNKSEDSYFMNSEENKDDNESNDSYCVDIFSDNSDMLSKTECEDTNRPITSSSKMTLQDYISMINEKNNGANQLTVEGNKIKIVTLDNTILKIYEQNFHGFYNLNGQTICGTCQYVVSDMDGDIDDHKMCSDHIEKVSVPFRDMHCIRSGVTCKHCVLCNSMFIKLNAHKKSKLHLAILNKLRVITDTSMTSTSETTNSIVTDTVCETDTSEKKQTTSPSVNKESKLYIDSHNLDGHTRGKFHIANVEATNELISTNLDTVNETRTTYCPPCNKHIDTHNLSGHLEGKTHKHNQDIYINTASTSSAEKTINVKNQTSASRRNKISITYCVPCKLYIQTHNMKGHVQGKFHKGNLKIDNITPADSKFETILHRHMIRCDNPNELLCLVCNANIKVLSEWNVTVHVHGKTHIANFENLTKTMHHHLEQVGDKIECVVCDVEVHLSNIEKHCQSSKLHDVEFKTLLSFHRIVIKCDAYYCETCSVEIEDEIEHLNSENHNECLNNLSYRYDCSICDVNVPGGTKSYNIHVNGGPHKKNLMKFLALT